MKYFIIFLLLNSGIVVSEEPKKEEIKLPLSVEKADATLIKELEAATSAYNKSVEESMKKYNAVIKKEKDKLKLLTDAPIVEELDKKLAGAEALLAAAREMQAIKLEVPTSTNAQPQPKFNIIGLTLIFKGKGEITFEKEEFSMTWDRVHKRKWTSEVVNNQINIILKWERGDERLVYNPTTNTFTTELWGEATIKK